MRLAGNTALRSIRLLPERRDEMGNHVPHGEIPRAICGELCRQPQSGEITQNLSSHLGTPELKYFSMRRKCGEPRGVIPTVHYFKRKANLSDFLPQTCPTVPKSSLIQNTVALLAL